MKPDIGSESRFLSPPPAFDAPVRGVPVDIEKLEWCGYPVVKNFEDMFIRFDRMYERERHTHRHTHTACIASRGKNAMRLSPPFVV